jgi:FkbM family methyltransferase
MKNVFIDLGTHYGQGLREFMAKYQMDSTWTIHTFEANPITHTKFKKEYYSDIPFVVSHWCAVGAYDGTIEMNLETPPNEDETGMGSSVIPLEQWDPWGNGNREQFKRAVKVPCKNLAKFIMDNFSKEDRIVIKMDIEGSEYDTLDKMIETGVIDYVNDLYVEWHMRFFRNPEDIRVREERIIQEIKSRGVYLESWK